MRLRLAAAGLVGALVLAGCTDDPDSSPEPVPTDSGSPTTSGTPSTVAPATGPLVEMPPGSFRVPAGWTLSDESLGDWFMMSATSDDDTRTVYLRYLDRVSWTLEEVERKSRASLAGELGEARVVDPTEVGGHPAYHVVGSSSLDRRDVYGFLVDGYWITLDFSVFGSDGEPDRDLIDSVLASWTAAG